MRNKVTGKGGEEKRETHKKYKLEGLIQGGLDR